MPDLPGPFEYLDLQEGQSLTTRILRWELGRGTVTPRDAPEGKEVDVLRIHVPQEDKGHFPYYWDVSGKGLQAQLIAHLERPDLQSLTFTMTARGIAPKKRYTLTVSPTEG